MTQTELLTAFLQATQPIKSKLHLLYPYFVSDPTINQVEETAFKGKNITFVGGSFDTNGYAPGKGYGNTHYIPGFAGMDQNQGACLFCYLNDEGIGSTDQPFYGVGKFYISRKNVQCGGEAFGIPVQKAKGLHLLNQIPGTDRLRLKKDGVLVKEFVNPIKAISEGEVKQMELYVGGYNYLGNPVPNYTLHPEVVMPVHKLNGAALGLTEAEETILETALLNYVNGSGIIVPPPPTTGLTDAEIAKITTDTVTKLTDIIKTALPQILNPYK